MILEWPFSTTSYTQFGALLYWKSTLIKLEAHSTARIRKSKAFTCINRNVKKYNIKIFFFTHTALFIQYVVKCTWRAMRKERYGTVGGEGFPKLRGRRSCGRGWGVHDQSLYFEITYFSISLINGASFTVRQRQGPWKMMQLLLFE